MSARRDRSARAVAVALAVIPTLLAPACSQRERERERERSATASEGGAPPTSSGSGTDASAAPHVGSATLEPPFAPPSDSDPHAHPRPDAPVAPLPEKAWVWKTYRGDHFSALFPGEPRISTLPEEDDKVGYTEARVEVPGGQVSFTAGFSDFPQSEVDKPEAFLDDHATPPRRGFTDVLHKRVTTLPGGQPGRVLILRRNISGTPLRVYSRLYLVGRRLYSLIVSTLDVGGVSEDVVKKFMDSFKLTQP